MRSIIMIIPIIVLYASTILAAPPAPRNYHDWPEITDLPDTGRIQIYDPREPVKLNRHKNITGAKIKEEARSAVNAPNDTPISKQAIDANPYKRTYESKDPVTGKINWYVQSNGSVVVVGVLTIGALPPAPLTVSSIIPANGATGFMGGPITVTFNKYPASLSASYMYVQGVTTANSWPGGGAITSTAYLAPNTSYTYKVIKDSLAILQTDGETTAACGTAMSDVSGVCQSTFATGGLNIYSTTPAVGAVDVPGTDGGSFNTTPDVTFGLTVALITGQYTCSSSRWDGAAWVADTTPGAFTNTGNAIYTLPSMIYHRSYDASHLTTYTCSVPKSIGLTNCAAGMTDTGTLCQWSFTTAL